MTYEQLEEEYRLYKKQKENELRNNIEKIEKKINSLINQTPTGKLRNELTEINILFISILQHYNNTIN